MVTLRRQCSCRNRSEPCARSRSLHDNFDLSPFRILESLCLELSIGRPAHVIPTLVQVVPAIETLKSLRLRGSISVEDMIDLVNRGRIFGCLGPNAVSISLEWQLFLHNLVDFARNIPSANEWRPRPLKCFNCLPFEVDNDRGPGSQDEVKECDKRKLSVVGEFRKRGIELRFDASRA